MANSDYKKIPVKPDVKEGMKAVSESGQEKVKGVLRVTFNKQVDRVVRWLAKQMPNGYHKNLIGHHQVENLYLRFYFQIGFYFHRNSDITKHVEGLQPAAILFLKGEMKNQGKAGQVRHGELVMQMENVQALAVVKHG